MSFVIRQLSLSRLRLIIFALALFYCAGAYAQQDATAVATVNNGSVARVMITYGGSGYISPPNVAFIGGGGTGASAIAQVGGGSVTNIVIQSPGSGYTNAPIVAIDPPPQQITPAIVNIDMVPRLTINSQPWQVQQVQYTTSLTPGNQWVLLTNVVMGTNPWVFVDINAAGSPRFYRVVTIGAPGPNPSRWAWINPGTFLMGSPVTEFDRSPDESPQTQMTFTNGFWMERFELTQWEYTAVVGTNYSTFNNDSNQPVEQVSWYDASNYCALLTTKEQAAGRLPPGYVYRLPTEAEWEYVCRAGTTTRFPFGNDLNYTLLLNYGWISTNSPTGPSDVGKLLPNPWGVYDMSGNIWEWCADYYNPYPGGSVTNPISPPVSTNGVVMRGGSWRFPGGNARSAARNFNPPNFYSDGIGVRVVLAPPLK